MTDSDQYVGQSTSLIILDFLSLAETLAEPATPISQIRDPTENDLESNSPEFNNPAIRTDKPFDASQSASFLPSLQLPTPGRRGTSEGKPCSFNSWPWICKAWIFLRLRLTADVTISFCVDIVRSVLCAERPQYRHRSCIREWMERVSSFS